MQFTIFGLFSFTSGLLNLLLEETLNRTLPETLDDLKNDGTLRNERGRYARLSNADILNEDESEEDDTRTVEVSPVLTT